MPAWECVARSRTHAASAAAWSLLLDGRSWSQWCPGVEWMIVEGDLTPGTYVTIKPKRWLQTAFRISAADPQRRLAIATAFGPLAEVTLSCEFVPQDAGCEIVLRAAVSGPAAGMLARLAGKRVAAALTEAAASAARAA